MTTFGDILKKAEQEGATFEVLEAGEYAAKIIESDYQRSANGKPQIKTRWEVVQGPKAGFKSLWNYFTLTVDNPNAMAIFYRQMTALGITSEFMQTLANVDPETAMKHIAQALNGRAANIKVKVDTEWNNNKIERIRQISQDFTTTMTTGPAADPFAQAAVPPATPAPAAPPTPAAAQPAPVPAQPPVAAPAAPVPPEAPPAAPAVSESVPSVPAPPF